MHTTYTTKQSQRRFKIRVELTQFRAEGFQAKLASLDVGEKPVWPLLRHFTR